MWSFLFCTNTGKKPTKSKSDIGGCGAKRILEGVVIQMGNSHKKKTFNNAPQ